LHTHSFTKLSQKCILVALDLGQSGFTDSIEEMRLLADSAGADVVAQNISRRSKIEAATFIGSGKAAEIAATIEEFSAELVLFAHALSPAQQRNLERIFKVRVVDRTALILDIFALRAHSHEGKLQVELAQLQHLSTRLVKMWSHLERQRGGIGMRGPGESQLEMDKRIIADKIRTLKEKLEKLRKQRLTQRRNRSRSGVFTVSVVGYTNAGKSTLFNTLTKANTYTANQLFATLDTTSRQLTINNQQMVMTDTVGFIRELPTTLIAAFRATLEEALNADLLIHVIDCVNSERDAHIRQVNEVLTEIGVGSIPQCWVMNKIDLLSLPATVEHSLFVQSDLQMSTIANSVPVFGISAKTGVGIDGLRKYLSTAAKAASFYSTHSHSNESICYIDTVANNNNNNINININNSDINNNNANIEAKINLDHK
jgi:GTPase